MKWHSEWYRDGITVLSVYEIGHPEHASREHRMSHLIALFMFNYASMMSLLLWFQKLEGTNFTTVIRFQPNLLEETIELPVQFQPPIIIASPIESHIQPTYDSRTEYAPSGSMICTTAIVWKGMHSLHNVGSTFFQHCTAWAYCGCGSFQLYINDSRIIELLMLSMLLYMTLESEYSDLYSYSFSTCMISLDSTLYWKSEGAMTMNFMTHPPKAVGKSETPLSIWSTVLLAPQTVKCRYK